MLLLLLLSLLSIRENQEVGECSVGNIAPLALTITAFLLNLGWWMHAVLYGRCVHVCVSVHSGLRLQKTTRHNYSAGENINVYYIENYFDFYLEVECTECIESMA